jgi:hypothetical protein
MSAGMFRPKVCRHNSSVNLELRLVEWADVDSCQRRLTALKPKESAAAFPYHNNGVVIGIAVVIPPSRKVLKARAAV